MSARTLDDIRPHTTFTNHADGSVTALFACGEDHAMATGEDADQALLFVLAKLRGDKIKITQRPWLRLCTPCNKRAAAAGDNAASKGVELCAVCARAVDEWKEAHQRWMADQKRRAKNKRKRKRKARRR